MTTSIATPAPTFLTYGQAAAYLGVSSRTLRRLVSAREITHLRPGGQVRFTREHLDEYLLSSTVYAGGSVRS